jgi:hypothetical protein
MCDTLLLAFLVWGAELWLGGLELRSRARLAAGGLLIGVAALTKYFGMSFIPLMFAATLMSRRRATLELLFLLVPVALLALFQTWTWKLYGRGLLSDAAGYSITARGDYGISGWWRLIDGLSFLGGGTLPIVMCAPFLYRARVIAGWSAVAVLVALLLGTCPASFAGSTLVNSPQHRWQIACHLGLFTTGGLLSLAVTVDELRARRDPQTLLLALWFGGTFVFAAFLNWSVNARSLLPVAPALGIILARALERDRPRCLMPGTLRMVASLGPALSIAALVAASDSELAGAARSAAHSAVERLRSPGRDIWFSGHWGFQWYMQQGGARPFAMGATTTQAGDTAVFPFRNSGVFGPPEEDLEPLDKTCMPLTSLIATMDPSLGAGFYADVYGPLPFVAANRRRDCYGLMQFRRGLRLNGDGSWVPNED